MPKVSVEYRESRRHEIAQAAMRAFQRRGFQATSMADIIAESGLSAGAIYGHYKSKTEIVHEVAQTLVDERLVSAEDLLDADVLIPPGELVGHFLRSLFAESFEPSILLQLWGESVTDPEMRLITSGIMERLGRMYERHLAAWHERENGRTPGHAADLAARQAPLFVSVAAGYMLQATLREDFDGDDYLSAAAEYLPR
jgi:AcrR family transcriptional regulator